MPLPQVSIVVTTYQQPQHLLRVLTSIAAQRTAQSFEVIVTDDGSTDDTANVVQTFAASAAFAVRFVTAPHNGFRAAACRNRGVALAEAEIVLLLDGDCLIPPDHLHHHLGALRPGLVTNSYCLRLDEAITAGIDLADVRQGRFVRLGAPEEYRKLRRMQRKARWYQWLRHPTKPRLLGGNVCLARRDYLRVNGMDENFRGWGGEDDDFGFRLRRAGLKISYLMDRTWTYHLWHPPHRPARIKDGANVSYLSSGNRPWRCVRGIDKHLTTRV